MAPTDQAKPTSTDKLMTPANIVTLARICLVPVFVVVLISPWPQWLGLPQVADDAKSLIAAGIFILISCTDWLDGYLARSRGEVTDFGKFMDPLADKILVAAALLALIELGSLPSWVALVILARRVLGSARRAGVRLGTAESLTGGLVAAALTGVPGSSETVRGGVVSYVNDVKHGVLGVPRETLERHGAVSAETARAMAQGARRDLGADIAVSVTGIAGPGGAEPGKPVGTVWVGLADAEGAEARLHEFPGDRAQVRLLTVRAALERLEEALEGADA